MTSSQLGKIACVTVSAPDLDAIETAYSSNFGYRVSERGKVTDAQAKLWNAEKMVGAATLIMEPSSGTDFVFRFIERQADPDYVPLTTWGWNASEVLVENVDALAQQLTEGDFEMLGEPKNLSFTDDIRAMQLRGPANEILYMTELKAAIPGMDLPTSKCFVDNTFIVILGGGDINAMMESYEQQFEIAKAPVMESRITVASKAFGLSIEQRYPIAALGIKDQCMIEVDELPEQAGPRNSEAGLLPPGIAMVSFRCNTPATEASITCDGLPYAGKQASCTIGAAGELIELLHYANN
ncbi:MAG: hypothetical protein P8R04_03585 [Gammaproteobacteria bacterium]|nr:hypothetical protein [Gammaproteobacteria bacterium]